MEARNSYGYSPYSDVLAVLCATKPEAPATPTTTVVASDVIVDWNPPVKNGLPILSYTVYIQKSDGSFELELTDCDGSSADVVLNSQCVIPLDTLTASPFNLNLGDSVKAKLFANNEYGDSPMSGLGEGAVIVLVPDAPLTLTEDPSITL